MTILREIFKRQHVNSMQLAFEKTTDFKSFFYAHDGLHNLEEDLVYTLLGRYDCGSGCQTCFLKGHWLRPEQLLPHIHTPTTAYQDMVTDIFGRFQTIACIDDMHTMKTRPDLYEFYRNHAPRMEFHTSDNGFFKQYDLLINDLKFNAIGQISFSDHLLSSKGGKIVDDIIPMLRELNDRSPIARLNFVITRGNPVDNPHIMKICEWALGVDQTLAIYFHNDIRHDVDYFAELREQGYKQPSCYHIETTTNPVTKCNVYTETVHLRYDNFFPDLYTSMEENSYPFYTCQGAFNPDTLMVELLREKIRMYARNCSIMTVRNKLYDYFNFASTRLRVRDDFTFIPSLMLKPESKFYQRLVGNGYTNTYAGLIRTGCAEVIPIAEIISD